MQRLLQIGVIILVLAFGSWFFKDAGNELPLSPHLDMILFAMGIAAITIFLVMFFIGMVTGTTLRSTRKNRCVRCGKKVPRGEVYCEFHQSEVSSEFMKHQSDQRDSKRRN